MIDTYRLSWEMVRLTQLHKYCNADPLYYKNTTQIVPNSEIPDEDWQTVSKETSDPWDQFHQLKEWANNDEQFIRNVKLEKMATAPEWVDITDD